MGLRAFWQQYRAHRTEKFLAAHPTAALTALRQDPSLAAEALHRMYTGDAAFVARINEMEAQARAPERATFSYPALAQLGMGGKTPLQRTLPKIVPWALRRFAEFPPSRRAIQAIKLPILDLPFSIGLRKPVGARRYDADPEPTEEQHARIEAVTTMLRQPNEEYTGREFLEMLLEDLMVLGAGVFEVQSNHSDIRPCFLWAVDAQSVRLNTTWTPGSQTFRFSQARGAYAGQAGMTDDVYLDDEDLCYTKLNPRTHTPFGLGYLEVAFGTVNAFIGSFEYAERRASNTTPNYLIFLGENAVPEQVTRFRHYWENEIEGFGKIPIVGGGRAPSVQSFTQDTTDPLYMKWQEWLVRIVAMAFGLSPMRLGLERDVNRSTAEQGAADDWATIGPVANILREAVTHWLLWRRLGYQDLEFTWQVRTSDELKQAEILAQQYEMNGITVDEIRQVYERSPLEDGLGNMTKSPYEAAVKAAVVSVPAVPGPSQTVGPVTPFDDQEQSAWSPQQAAFVRKLMQQHRRERLVAG